MTSTEPIKKSRIRLSPEARRSMLLDHTAQIIADEGVSAVTMDRLAKEANISKGLIYNYFPKVTNILQELLTREYKHLRSLQFEAAESAKTIEQLVRRVTKVYISYINDRGLIIDRLAMEPSVANSGDPTEYSRSAAVRYIAEIFHKSFDIEMDIAEAVVDISYGLPAAAGQYLQKHDGVDAQTIEDITVQMLLGSLEGVKKNYDLSLRPLKK